MSNRPLKEKKGFSGIGARVILSHLAGSVIFGIVMMAGGAKE